MANSKQSLADKKILAHDLCMRTEKTLKEIAQLCDVKYDTLCEWAQKGKWKELKAANSVTRAHVINNTLMMIKELQDEINGRTKKYPDYKEQMTLSMMADDIRKLDKSLSIADYITMTEELMKGLAEVNLELAKQVGPYILEFAQNKAKRTAA